MKQALACFHCGLPVEARGRWTVPIDGQPREMCCAGCQAVARAIVDGGLDDYYRHRTAVASGPNTLPAELAALLVYDEPEVQSRYVRDDGQCAETTLLMEGLRCGACVWLIERTLAAQPGVVGASVNFATERAVLRWDPSRTRLSELLARIAAIGYHALPYDPRQREAQLARVAKSLFRRLFVAGIGMMQVMMYAIPIYTSAPGDVEWQYEHLMRWASLLLTVPVVFYSAQPFFSGALRDLHARSLGMDVPVALGVGAAFAASAWATWSGRGEVYFDSVTMFVFLLLGARYLEWIARRRASRAVDLMAAALPERVNRLIGVPVAHEGAVADEADLAALATEAVPAARLAPGEIFRVAVGERIAVDAEVVAGHTEIDQSLLTGESLPVARAAGDAVPGGAINAGSPVFLRVLRTSDQSTLSTIERLIERAAQDKPALAQLADRVAAVFVLALLAFSAAVLAAWGFIDPPRALPIAIAVLVVSCPCALSLATPAALAAAIGAVTRRGVLVASGRALESIAQCTDVVFDKTGTLTVGRPRLTGVQTPGLPDAATALRIAAALEAGATHPLADALLQAAREAMTMQRAVREAAPTPLAAHEARTPPQAAHQAQAPKVATGLVRHPGLGVEGVVDGRTLRLGSRAFVQEWLVDAAEAPAFTGSEAWLAERGRVLARFTLDDALRPDARAAVDALRRAGLRVHLLSGDRPAAVEAVARALGIDAFLGGATPDGKLEFVQRLQGEGRRVLMVGDGVNDAPVLAAADASLAVGQASALARTAADTVLLSPQLSMVPALVGMARRTRGVILQNLAWATVYNLVAIPAAALGWVPPWLAAVGMSASSLLVVGNALRLRLSGPIGPPPAAQ